jgi:hypothetical protein
MAHILGVNFLIQKGPQKVQTGPKQVPNRSHTGPQMVPKQTPNGPQHSPVLLSSVLIGVIDLKFNELIEEKSCW